MTENTDDAYEVDFMNLIVDKADNLRVIGSDSHFSDFTGVHPSKIKQGKLFLHDVIKPFYREKIMKTLCKKNSPYVYFNAEFIDKDGNDVYIYCTGQNFENSTYCRLTLADVSRSQKKHEALRKQAKDMGHLFDRMTFGVAIFKVTNDMHIEAQYLNTGACRLFGTSKAAVTRQHYRLDELIYPEDKSAVFQAIGRAMATGEAIDIKFRSIVHRDEYKWCKLNADIDSYDSENNPVFYAIFTDINGADEPEKAEK